MKKINFAMWLLCMLAMAKANAQSFDDEKISAINFIKRVYASSPFEGVKKIETEYRNYYAVAATLVDVSADSLLAIVPMAQKKAQTLAEVGFAEPCVKFEMIERYQLGNQCTYLFFCITLEDFVTDFLKKRNVDGSKIISAPNNKFVIANISLENTKYASAEMRDKAAFMKIKQMVNTMVNGSTITSDQIIRTDETDARTQITNTEIIREQAMGFVQGLELLFSKEITTGKTSYVYYSKM